MDENFADGDIHEKVVKLLSDTNDQIEWVENLPISNQENEEDCNKWLSYLGKVKDSLAELVNQEVI